MVSFASLTVSSSKSWLWAFDSASFLSSSSARLRIVERSSAFFSWSSAIELNFTRRSVITDWVSDTLVVSSDFIKFSTNFSSSAVKGPSLLAFMDWFTNKN